uniref:Integrase core domain containing protein n=1 Tax=Solanum tuberosum TaxID=4113 RepID=M1DIJ0_SOLTU
MGVLLGVHRQVQENPQPKNAERVQNQQAPAVRDNYRVDFDVVGSAGAIEIVGKLEKISKNDKAWSTKTLATTKSMFSIQATPNYSNNDISEEMTTLRTEVSLVLKHRAIVPVWGCDRFIEEDEGTILSTTTEPKMTAPPSTLSGLAANTPHALTPIGFAMLPLARVQNLETQMLRRLERPQYGPTVDVVAFQTEFAKLWVGIDALAIDSPEPALEDDAGDVCAHNFGHTRYPEEERRSRKRERTHIEAPQRQSLLDEEMHQLRERELVAGASALRGTTDGVPPIIVDGVTEGITHSDLTCSALSDPPTS